MYLFNITNDICLDIYLNYNFNLNDYNKVTKQNICDLKQYLDKDYFVVPSYIRYTEWGFERIFFPFTDKLFKIVSTNHNDTSIQLHPRKSEVWYPLVNSTIFDGNKWINVTNKNKIIIPKNSIHCMKYNSSVFEVQDNSFFDTEETIRIFDINNRIIEDKDKYLKYCLPHNKDKLKIEHNQNNIHVKGDVFLFIIDGQAKINGTNLVSNELYYVKEKMIKMIEMKGNIVVVPAIYINVTYAAIN